jgi:steroid 5-alpha reductase family enzyme
MIAGPAFGPLPALRGSPLLTVFAIDFGIQAAFYAESLLRGKSEKFYDLSGALTYTTCFLYSYLARGGVYDPRKFIATAAGCLWAARLGGYLFERIQREGKDERFDNLKSSAGRFAVPWFMQAAWVGLVGAPVSFLVGSIRMRRLLNKECFLRSI